MKFKDIVNDMFEELIDSQQFVINSEESENVDYFYYEFLDYFYDKFKTNDDFQIEVAQIFLASYKKYFTDNEK